MTDFSTRERPPDRAVDLLLIGAGAVALVFALYGAVSAYRLARATHASLAETRAGVGALRERIRRLEDARASTEEQRLAARVVLGAQTPVAASLAALERVLPPDVRLEALALVYEEGCQLEMTVEARRPAAYDDFLTRLFASPHFADVTPGAENRGDTLRASVRERFRGVRP